MAAKDYRRILAALARQGWELSSNANGHYRAVPPGNGSIVHFSTTSGDPRALRNTLRDLRSNGFVWQADGFGSTQAEPTLARTHLHLAASEEASSPSSFLEQVESSSASTEPDLDALFAALKTARDDAALAVMEVGEAEHKLEQCKVELEAAITRHKQAALVLREAKQAFDEAFGVQP